MEPWLLPLQISDRDWKCTNLEAYVKVRSAFQRSARNGAESMHGMLPPSSGTRPSHPSLVPNGRGHVKSLTLTHQAPRRRTLPCRSAPQTLPIWALFMAALIGRHNAPPWPQSPIKLPMNDCQKMVSQRATNPEAGWAGASPCACHARRALF